MYFRPLASLAALSLALSVVAPALAKHEKVSVSKGNGGAMVSIPAHAAELAPDVYSLGTAVHDGKHVEGIMVVHRSNAKPGGVGGGGSTTCYSYIASGAKWKSQEPWVINPANNFSLTDSLLLTTTDAVITEWETAAGAPILGAGSITTASLTADETTPDGVNEIYFGEIADPGVIAVTITWGTFGGPTRNRRIIEMDQVYDQVDYSWASDGAPASMDYENIAQHEIGHGIGMGHSPTSSACANETMYPYASNGEIIKRDLGPGDIEGVNKLY